MRKGASPGTSPDSSDYVATITPFDPGGSQGAALRDDARSRRHAAAACVLPLARKSRTRASRGARFATVGGMRDYRAAVVIDATADALVADSGRRTDAAGRRARARAAGNADLSAEPRRSRRSWRRTARASRRDAHLASRGRAHRVDRSPRSRACTSCGNARARTDSSTCRASWSRFSSRRIPTR